MEGQPQEMQSERDFFFLCTYRKGLLGHSAPAFILHEEKSAITHTHTHTDVRHTDFTLVTFQKASLQHT